MKHLNQINPKFLLLLFWFLFSENYNVFSQIAIEWQKCLQVNNSQSSFGWYVSTTIDNGLIIASQSDLIGQGPNFTLIKTDSIGNKQWSVSYGGTSGDYVRSVVSSMEGGYILAGTTWSNNGDVTGFHGGQTDAWVVKTDNNGALLWQKTFGGSNNDFFYSVIQNQFGEYVAAGQSLSSDGDLSGLGSSPAGWVIKFDSSGTILDQKRPLISLGIKIIPTNDHGYAIGGAGGGLVSYGLQDFGIVKLDSSLNTQWTKGYGGTEPEIAWDIIQATDGSYVLSGGTSSNDVFVSGNHGSDDIWVIKLDSMGDFIWQRCLGGISQEDYNAYIVETGSGNYIIAGNFFGNSGAINDSISVRYASNDIWITELDTSGTLLWEKTIGGGSVDVCGSIIKTNDH